MTIPNSVESIGTNAFWECTSLTSVTIPDSVKSIGYCAFQKCTSLKSVTIPSSVESIDLDAFEYCTSLASLTIQDGVKSIGDCAFQKCTSLKSVTIPGSVESIGYSVFGYCTSLTSVIIPDSVESIGDSAFQGCTSLTFVMISNKVKSIGYNVFGYCTSLTSVTIPDSVESIGYDAFEYCSSLTSLTIPNSVKSIGYSAFWHCTSLTSVTIPDSMESIEAYTFWECTSLTSVTIPDSVKSIGLNVFESCGSLSDVYYLGTRDQWDVVSKEYAAIPADAVHTYEDRTARVNLTLTGMTANDRITLTDGPGSAHQVTASGTYPLWPVGAEILIQPATGRQFGGSVSYTVAGGGTVYETEAVGIKGSMQHAFSLDLASGEANVTVGFSKTDGEYYRLIVQESELDTLTDAAGHGWTITDDVGKFYKNGDPLAVAGEMGEARSFTLSLTPGGWGCIGGLYQNGSLNKAITNELTDYTFEVSSDVTVQLGWYDHTVRHQVTYDGNGGTGRMPVQLAADGAAVTVLDNAFTARISRVYQFFTGWNTQADGKGTPYLPGGSIKDVRADVTLYAQWAPAYRVLLKPNHPGSHNDDSDFAILVRQTDPDDPDYTPAVTLPDDIFTSASRAISGWNTNENGNGTPYDVGSLTLTGDLTLFAQWASAWTVTFDPNGAKCDGFSRAVVRGKSLILPDETGRFQWAVKDFAGWNTQSDGQGTPYAAGAPFAPEENCTLYAQWIWKPFAVECTDCTAQVDGATANEARPDTVLTLVPGYKTGFRFKEWQVTPEIAEITEKNTFTMPATNVKISAIFEPLPPFGTATFTLPASLTAIGDNAFAGVEAITIVDASNCAEIGANAFSGCTQLEKILLPADCKIDDTAFDGCSSLIAIYAPGGHSTQSWAERHNILFMPTDE